MSNRTSTLLLVAVLAGATTASAQATYRVEAADVTVNCPMTIGGSFDAKTQAGSGDLTYDAATGAITGSVAVDLTTIDTGIGLRNRHLREKYLEVERGPEFAAVVLQEITLAPGTTIPTAEAIPFTGSLSLHGVTKPVAGTVTITANGAGLVIDANFPVVIPEYDIKKPRHLGVGVKDQVEIQVRLELVAATASSAVAGDPS